MPTIRSGGAGRAAFDALYAAAPGNLLLPVMATGGLISAATTSAWFTVNQGRCARFICNKSGTLSDVSFFVVAAAGNYDVAVYDDGSASAGNRTKLASLGSTALAGAGVWVGWNPALAVTAGQHIDIGFSCSDATTAAVLRWANMGNAAQSQLPAGYLTAAGGAPPKLAWQAAAQMPFTTPITEATCANTSGIPVLVARIT